MNFINQKLRVSRERHQQDDKLESPGLSFLTHTHQFNSDRAILFMTDSETEQEASVPQVSGKLVGKLDTLPP